MAAEHPDVPRHKPVIVSVGRLIHSKGFDVLLKAFSHVRKSVDCTLLIIGDGVEKTRLKECAASLAISGDVVFAGFTRNPFKYMNQAHLFCTATRYEGLGNAIIEAMALGLPVIATDCRSGPAETLGGGKYGILVPPEDDRAFAGAMIQVLSDHSLRESLSRCSLERAGYFGPDALMKQWEDTILSA